MVFDWKCIVINRIKKKLCSDKPGRNQPTERKIDFPFSHWFCCPIRLFQCINLTAHFFVAAVRWWLNWIHTFRIALHSTCSFIRAAWIRPGATTSSLVIWLRLMNAIYVKLFIVFFSRQVSLSFSDIYLYRHRCTSHSIAFQRAHFTYVRQASGQMQPGCHTTLVWCTDDSFIEP